MAGSCDIVLAAIGRDLYGGVQYGISKVASTPGNAGLIQHATDHHVDWGVMFLRNVAEVEVEPWYAIE